MPRNCWGTHKESRDHHASVTWLFIATLINKKWGRVSNEQASSILFPLKKPDYKASHKTWNKNKYKLTRACRRALCTLSNIGLGICFFWGYGRTKLEGRAHARCKMDCLGWRWAFAITRTFEQTIGRKTSEGETTQIGLYNKDSLWTRSPRRRRQRWVPSYSPARLLPVFLVSWSVLIFVFIFLN